MNKVARPEPAEAFQPIWPLRKDIEIANTGDVQGISPIPCIWVIGAPETGKSSFIATVDPVRPGTPTRTLMTDLEMSSTTVRTQIPIEVVDIRKMAEAATPVGSRVPAALTLFETWMKYVLDAPNNYTVLGVDPASDLKIGANLWVKQHAELFGKVAAAYGGKDGTIFSWGDTNLYWKDLILKLAARYQTVVLTSHPSDVFDKSTGRRTGQQTARSTDFKEIATLTLWLSYEREKNQRWAMVQKSRLSWYDWQEEDGKERRRPVMRDLLPKKLVPRYQGQSYPELIAEYMEAPQRDYGDLNTIENDPSIQKLSADDLEDQKREDQERELELAVKTSRSEMVADLLASGKYKDSASIAAKANELGITFSIKEREAIFKQLLEAAS